MTRAVDLFRELGDRLREARALNTMGEVTPPASAPTFHQQALAIAQEIGSHAEKARALEGIGRSHLQNNQKQQAAEPLRQALRIYRRISSPSAATLELTLREHEL